MPFCRENTVKRWLLAALLGACASLTTGVSEAQTMCIEAPESVALAVLASMVPSARPALSTLEGEPPLSVAEVAAAQDLPSIPALLWCVSAWDARCMPAHSPEASGWGTPDGAAAAEPPYLPSWGIQPQSGDEPRPAFGGMYVGRPSAGTHSALERPPRH